MPSVESHVKECVKALGEEHRHLCYMVNSWMDAPSRNVGAAHRVYRHDPVNTPIEACRIYGETVDGAVLVGSPINNKITYIVRQHLVLDGLLPPTDLYVSGLTDGKGHILIIRFDELIGCIAVEKARMIRDTIQGLENKLIQLKAHMLLWFLLLFVGLLIWLHPLYIFVNVAFFVPLFFIGLILTLFSAVCIMESISSYFDYSNTYRKMKEQEKFGQIECVECKAKTAVLAHKHNSTFIICGRCGFAWKSYDYVKSRLSRSYDRDKSFDELKGAGLQLLNELSRYFPNDTIIDVLQELRIEAKTTLEKVTSRKAEYPLEDYYKIKEYWLKQFRLWSYLIGKIQPSSKTERKDFKTRISRQ